MTTIGEQPQLGTDYVDLSAVLQTIIEKKWLVLSTGLIIFIFAMIYTLIKPKKYQASLLLEINQSQAHSLESFAPTNQTAVLQTFPQQSIATHIALMRSKFILLPVIHSLGLDRSRSTSSSRKMVKTPESLILNKMQAALSITDLSNSTEAQGTKGGLIELTYTGENAEQTASILNEIARITQEKNRDYQIQALEKKIAFLKNQLPVLKQSLQASELQLSQYKSTSQKMNTQLQTRYLTEHLSELDKQLQELHFKKAALLQQYTMHYPFVQSISTKIGELENQRLQIYRSLKKLPAEDQAADAILREMRLKNKLYLALLNQIHELEMTQAGMMSEIHVLVPATPPDLPLPIKLKVIGLGSLVLGLLLGCFFVLAWNIFTRRIQDPRWLENVLGIQNLVTVPYLTPASAPLHEEAFCYLRTYLQRRQSNYQNKIINLFGLTQGVGKTFIVANVAKIFAPMKQKILVVDANLHHSDLHRYFSATAAPGVTDVLLGKTKLAAAVVEPANSPELHFLPAGTNQKSPLDLLSSQRFKEMLDELAPQYDLILLNSASTLFPSDCAYLGSLSDINLLVLGSNLHRTTDIIAGLKRVKQLGLHIHGSIFNHVKKRASWLSFLHRFTLLLPRIFDTKINQSRLECSSFMKGTGE